MSKAEIAVIGCGYWGRNLVRTFHDLNALRVVCDTSEKALSEMHSTYFVATTNNLNAVLSDPLVKGVVIAAPAAQHYELARRSLLSGKDVYVEKPLALRVNEGHELVELAAANERILMVGHILEYHPAIRSLQQLIAEGELGRIRYIYSSRLNLGKLRTEENILWSFAPHDISAILCLLNETPEIVTSRAGTYLDARIPDTTFTTCEFRSGVTAHIFVSWLHPFKEQKLAIVGGKKMAVFDEVEPERKLTLYSHRIDWRNRMPVALKDDGHTIDLPKHEPLRLECEHFIHCIDSREQPRTNGESGLRVLQVLDACQRSLQEKGRPVELYGDGSQYDAHPTAVIDSGCTIGSGTKIWHFSHIMAGAQLGRHCNIGQNVVVSPGVKIGNKVKIQNNVSVYTGVELEDDVFCGPSMVFTNVVNPRSHINRKHEYRRTLVKKGASIGANATVVCGVTLGRYSFVGAGAVVTRDVPDHALVVGVPAEQVGWVCYCGARIQVEGSRAGCSVCTRKYTIEDGACREFPRLQSVPSESTPLAA